jgi:hypothetical protein
MSGRFRNKDLQLPADLLSVFDSNQENTVCYALNGFYEHENAAKTRPRRIAALGGGNRSRGSQDQGLSFAPAFVALAPDLNGAQ